MFHKYTRHCLQTFGFNLQVSDQEPETVKQDIVLSNAGFTLKIDFTSINLMCLHFS